MKTNLMKRERDIHLEAMMKLLDEEFHLKLMVYDNDLKLWFSRELHRLNELPQIKTTKGDFISGIILNDEFDRPLADKIILTKKGLFRCPCRMTNNELLVNFSEEGRVSLEEEPYCYLYYFSKFLCHFHKMLQHS